MKKALGSIKRHLLTTLRLRRGKRATTDEDEEHDVIRQMTTSIANGDGNIVDARIAPAFAN